MFCGQLHDEQAQSQVNVRDDKVVYGYPSVFSHNSRFFGVRSQFPDQIREG